MYLYVTDIDGTLSPCKTVIKRHQSLVSTRDDILANISTATDEVLPYMVIVSMPEIVTTDMLSNIPN